MSTDATTPDTIVLIHGFWVTPRSWEDWKARYDVTFASSSSSSLSIASKARK